MRRLNQIPINRRVPTDFKRLGFEPEIYIAVPPKDSGGIPAMNAGTSEPGMQLCCLFKAVPDASDPFGLTRKLEAILVAGGEQKKAYVYNIFSTDAPEAPLAVIRSSHGPYLCTPIPESVATTTTTTTTTTGIASECTGRCKWTWNSTSMAWTLKTNGCAAATTTSTTTTTTPDYCPAEGEPDPEPDPEVLPTCQCLQPTFCGIDNGDVTYTYCDQRETEPPFCTGSTTTTTTSDCCDTTTTAGLPPGCTEGCDWVCGPFNAGAWGWVQTSFGCAGECPCFPPEAPCVFGTCAEASTDCNPVPPDIPPGIPCYGFCEFWWVPFIGAWVWVYHGCSTAAYTCSCPVPSEPGDVCAPITTNCSTRTTTTITCEDACYTSTTTTTSTSEDLCDNYCRWEAVGSPGNYTWSKVSDNCNAYCPCIEPAYLPINRFEVAVTRCLGSQTTSTTEAPPTTTTTTTTTTTEPEPNCTTDCRYVCSEIFGGGYDWVKDPADICPEPDCLCPEPSGTCNLANEGQVVWTACGGAGSSDPTSTTTTSTSTTTSSGGGMG